MILLIAFGLSLFVFLPLLQLVLAVLGGFVLILFGVFQIREALTKAHQLEDIDLAESKPTRHPLIIGLIFSALNPFFIIWWFTVGAKIVLDALLFAALLGVIIMFLSHVWIDYVWLAGTAWLTQKGTHLAGSKGYKILIGVFGILLIYFGLTFCLNAILIVSFL